MSLKKLLIILFLILFFILAIWLVLFQRKRILDSTKSASTVAPKVATAPPGGKYFLRRGTIENWDPSLNNLTVTQDPRVEAIAQTLHISVTPDIAFTCWPDKTSAPNGMDVTNASFSKTSPGSYFQMNFNQDVSYNEIVDLLVPGQYIFAVTAEPDPDQPNNLTATQLIVVGCQ